MGGQWDYESLNAFFVQAKGLHKRNKMNFAGLKKPSDRANMIAYLRSLSASPVALPFQEQIDAEK